MPTISKIRFTNVVYEGGNKRYADEIFHFHGENSAIVLENGGGKTVFIQTALQAILPHTSLANRKIKDTFTFDDGPTHIAIEWIKNDRPRIYALTAITIFPQQNTIDSYRYVYEYGPNDANSIENLPFTQETTKHQKRIASHAEMKEYYSEMSQKSQVAYTFPTITAFTEYIEKNFQIIAEEWKSINTINSAEGDVERFFEACPTEKALYERLLIPTVEQSIAAFEKNQFVDIFEKYRDQFKLYKQLNAQLKEYDFIQQELSHYVDVVQTLHGHEQQYETEKQKGKAYFELLSKYMDENDRKFTSLEEQQEQLDRNIEHLAIKQKSYDIAVMEEKLKEFTTLYEELENEVAAVQLNLDEQELYFGQLKYADEKRLFNQSKQKLAQYVHQLQQMDEQYSTAQLLEQLDEVKAKIRGEYLTVEQRYEQQLKEVQQEKSQKVRMQEEQQQLITQLLKEQQQLSEKITKFELHIELNEKQADGIAKDVFEDDVQQQQPILELRTAWTRESQQLDEQIVQLKNEEKNLLLQKQQNEKRLETIAGQLIELKGQETKVKQIIVAIEENEQKLRTELMSVLPRVTEKTSLYLKEASLRQDLLQAWEKKERLYTTKLHEERLAFRYVDDYGQQQSFFADPYIAKKIPIWSQRFHYLETAIEYAMGDDQLQVDTELLAITLITTDEEKEKLEQYVFDSAKYLTYPIQIWTLSQAVAISQGKLEPRTNLLQPQLWHQLSDLEAFQKWQQQAQEAANHSKVQREFVDEERLRLKGLLTKLQDFYAQYPLTDYQQLQGELKKLQAQTYEVQSEKSSLLKEVANADEALGKINNKVNNKSQSKNYYDGKIELLLKYDQLLKEIQRVKQELLLEQQKHASVSSQRTKADSEAKVLSDELNEIRERIHTMNANYKVLIAERYLYKQAVAITPKFTVESYEVLAQQYSQIDNQINGINSSRHQMENQIEQQQTIINQHEKNLQQLQNEYSQMDDQFELPLDYEQELQRLPGSIKRLKEQLFIVSQKCNQAKEQKNLEEGALRLKRNELEEPIRFDMPLPNVKYQIEEEGKRLQLQQKQLTTMRDNFAAEKKKTEKMEQEMRILNAEHSFLALSVTATPLTTEEENDFSYRQQHFIDIFTKKLAESKGLIERQAKVAANSKAQFIQFCAQNVSEVRLRNTIIDGIKAKEAYGELVKHQQETEKTIGISRQYVERDLKKHDENLVQFVQRIHVHLRKVVEELKHIPRKTKVQVDGEDVSIYRFTIPEWTDEEGIVQIRARIDWIMDQLEQIESRTADEQESKQKSRKQLEEWLSTVQLLRYITQNKEWRILCRKVMNDNRISKNYETWSRSNAWSGGEKWSKNMALFLGVLNYVAEKRQSISSKKKSRTVILDNPFGKASSDHVLSPVFFIAKQLGFQIIALTAHVEGKFLHDYFPVVYSCRLRSAVGSDKLVMESKKTMHQAFFRDHNEELGEVVQAEQLNLFVE